MPLLRPVNRVLLLVLFLWTFNDFSVPFMLFGSAPPTQADIISIHIYENSFINWNFGTGSAMSVLLLLFLLLVTGVYLVAVASETGGMPGVRDGAAAWFRWARVIVLTLLGLFALIAGLRDAHSSLKPLQDVRARSAGFPAT